MTSKTIPPRGAAVPMSREAGGKGLLVYPVFFAKKAEVIEKNRDGVSRFVQRLQKSAQMI